MVKYLSLLISLGLTLPMQGSHSYVSGGLFTASKITKGILTFGKATALSLVSVILPTINKKVIDNITRDYDSLPKPEKKCAEQINEIITSCGISPDTINVRIDVNKINPGSPAYTIDRCGKKYLFLQECIVQKMNDEQISEENMKKWYSPILESNGAIAVVLRHELGHIANNDSTIKNEAYGEITAAVAAYGITWLISNSMGTPTTDAGLILSSAAQIAMGWINLNFLTPKIKDSFHTRIQEERADLFALEHTKDAQELRDFADACEKIGKIRERKNVKSWAKFLHCPGVETYYYNLSDKNRRIALKAMTMADEHPAQLERSLLARDTAKKLESKNKLNISNQGSFRPMVGKLLLTAIGLLIAINIIYN